MPEREYDVVVIGAGPAGEVAAGRLADGGLDVALCERELVGGECSFYACMPSKALLRPGELAGEVERVPGVRLDEPPLDAERALARRTEVVRGYDDHHMLPWLDDRGIDLVRETARIAGERRVVAGDLELSARRAVVLATGSTASLPPIPGLREASPWTNREGTAATDVPASLLVLGGGPVGCELAQAWARLGADVTLVEAAPRVLSSEEEFASEQVSEGLRAAGVEVRAAAEASAAERRDGAVRLSLQGGDELEASELLVATGREPRSGDLGVESIGLEPGSWLQVDDRMRVGGRDWLYAIGDVNGRSLLTHVGKYQARVASDVILGRDARAGEAQAPPRVTFTDPQLAATGMTLARAREEGIRARAVDVKTAGNAGGSFVGRDTAGTSRLVVDEERDVVVGATFVGYQTAELLHSASVAIAGEVPVARLREAIPAFPTRTEIWLRLLDAYAG